MPEIVRHLGGIVFRVGEHLHFLPATVALEVLPMPEIARVPGAPPELAGVAVVKGTTLPVVTVGQSRGCLLVCSYLGERVGLLGVEIVATGRFEAREQDTVHGEQVTFEGRPARLFDVSAVVARFRDGRWAV